MALLSGFDNLIANTSTFSDWLQKTNEMITLLREDVVTANSSGATTNGHAILNGTFVGNTIAVATELRGGDFTTSNTLNITSQIAISGNTDFANDVTVNIEGDLVYVLKTSNYIDLIPAVTNRLLGNTTNRWNGSFTDIDVSNTITANVVSVTTLTVTGDTDLQGNVTFGSTVTFDDLEVTGVASIANLTVSSLVTNTAALIGTSGEANTSSPTVIDVFDANVSYGFKYIVHGRNDDPSSVYTIEIMCGHNDANVFFTRFAELNNNFDCTLVPQLNGANIELVATCPNANTTNVHSFNIVRIETR